MGEITVHIDTEVTKEVSKIPAAVKKKELSLSWENLTVSVEVEKEDESTGAKSMEKKLLIDGVSGQATPGKLTVIMGPSGAGKTTLLNCLAGRNHRHEGEVLVNGRPWLKTERKLSAYVEQESLMFPLLTVEEYLTMSAFLRIKEDLTDAEREQRVQDVMSDLDLTKCKNTLIGGAAARVSGLSGGERKRTQFAAEVLTDPSIIFCDEPTSGLDSFMAASIVQNLRELATKGGVKRTVIATIHQPSSQVFTLFDELVILARGKVAFSAPASEALTHFEGLGYTVPPNFNPADHLMEILSVVPGKQEESFAQIKTLTDAWTAKEAEQRVESHAVGVVGEQGVEKEEAVEVGLYNSSYWMQFVMLFIRELNMKSRNPLEYKIPAFQAVFLGLIIGLLYLNIENTSRGVQDVNGGLFFITINVAFTSAFSVGAVFPKELPIFIREHQSSMYGVLPYYMAKQLADLPKQIYQPIIMGSVAFWMMGFSNNLWVWGSFCGILILHSMVCTSLGYMVSCACSSPDMVNAFLPLAILPSILFGGLFLNTANIPVYFIWLEYLSIIKYGYHLLLINVWRDFGAIGCSTADNAANLCTFADGDKVLNFMDVEESTYWPFVGVFISFLVFLRGLGYVFLCSRVSSDAHDM